MVGGGGRWSKREANKPFECVTNVSVQQVGSVSLLGFLLFFFTRLSAQTMSDTQEESGG